jgi:hypothetical protein
MKVILQADARFDLKLTEAHVELLVLYASRHYDAKCRSTAVSIQNQHHPFEGLLVGWRNTLNFWADSGSPEKSYVTATSSQIDLLRKVLEFRQPGTTPEQEALRSELQDVFADCYRKWNNLYDQWRVEWDSGAQNGTKAWTDYPFTELGDTPHQRAPIREVRVISYDGNKYCNVEVAGIQSSVKLGYLYTEPGRCGEVPKLDSRQIRRN